MSTDEVRALQEVDTDETHPGNDRSPLAPTTLEDVVTILREITSRQFDMERQLRTVAADVAVIRAETQKNSTLRSVLEQLTDASKDAVGQG